MNFLKEIVQIPELKKNLQKFLEKTFEKILKNSLNIFPRKSMTDFNKDSRINCLRNSLNVF